MRQLKQPEILDFLKRLEITSAGGDTPEWQTLHAELNACPALVHLPLGELIVAGPIPGILWAWALEGRIDPAQVRYRSDSTGGFNVQAIEGIVPVQTCLMDALNLVRELSWGMKEQPEGEQGEFEDTGDDAEEPGPAPRLTYRCAIYI